MSGIILTPPWIKNVLLASLEDVPQCKFGSKNHPPFWIFSRFHKYVLNCLTFSIMSVIVILFICTTSHSQLSKIMQEILIQHFRISFIEIYLFQNNYEIIFIFLKKGMTSTYLLANHHNVWLYTYKSGQHIPPWYA